MKDKELKQLLISFIDNNRQTYDTLKDRLYKEIDKFEDRSVENERLKEYMTVLGIVDYYKRNEDSRLSEYFKKI